VSEIDDRGLYVVLVRDTSERKALEREIIDASTIEQERIGRDIHDGIGQQLTALAMLAGSIEHRLSGAGHSDEAKEVKKLVQHLQDTLAQTRALARGLSPVEIVPEGLADALSELAESVRSSSGVECRYVGAKSVKVPDNIVTAHLYRIAQEAVHNALRHGRPSKVEARLVSDDHGLVLSVQDDGTGIEQVDVPEGRLGLHIMRYRAGIIGGQLNVGPAANGGTLVQCVIPKQ
jgi:signal transduction histidine kinase